MQLVGGLTLLLLPLAKYLPEQIHTLWPELKAPGMLLSQLCLATSILFLGTFIVLTMLVSYSKKINEKVSKTTTNKQNTDAEIFKNRKEKICAWREELGNFDNISDLHNTPLYQELYSRIPDKEKKEIFGNSAIECNIVGGVVLATDINNRVIARFHKVISDLEKEWGLI